MGWPLLRMTTRSLSSRVGGGAEPGGAVLVVDVARGPQLVQRALDPTLGVQRALRLPDVEAHAQRGQAGLDPGAHLLRCPAAQHLARVGRVRGGLLPELVRHLGGQLVDVVAVVAVLRHIATLVARQDGEAQVADLGVVVVEVVLARHLVAHRLQHAAEQVAHECAAGVAHGQRPGRVGAHELDIDPMRRGDLHASELRPALADGGHAGGHPRRDPAAG